MGSGGSPLGGRGSDSERELGSPEVRKEDPTHQVRGFVNSFMSQYLHDFVLQALFCTPLPSGPIAPPY